MALDENGSLLVRTDAGRTEQIIGGDVVMEDSPQAGLRWLLHTKDAQPLYERFGFGPPSERLMERPPVGGGSSGPH